ncbi:MAG: TRAP transporter small permease [Desulfobacter sp.]
MDQNKGSSPVLLIHRANLKISHWVDQCAGLAAMSLCAVMTIVVLLGVVFRYILNDPLVWSEELSTFAMVWVAMIGGSMGIKGSYHVGVSYVVDNVAWMNNHRRVIRLAVNLIILFFLVILLKEAVHLARFAKVQTSPAMGVSMFWPYFGLVFGGGLMILQVVSQIIDVLTSPKSVPQP